MKKFSLILNIVLAVAVIALYILHFTGIGTSKNHEMTNNMPVTSGNGIFYVQIDSVIAKFNMAKDLLGELETKYNASDATLKSREENLRREMNDYQNKVQKGLLTRSEMQTTEQQLYAKQQDLVKLQQDLTGEINEKQAVMNRQVIDAIMAYMKENSTSFNYKYVLGTSFGVNILYANDSLDITDKIIEGLNENYSQKNKK